MSNNELNTNTFNRLKEMFPQSFKDLDYQDNLLTYQSTQMINLSNFNINDLFELDNRFQYDIANLTSYDIYNIIKINNFKTSDKYYREYEKYKVFLKLPKRAKNHNELIDINEWTEYFKNVQKYYDYVSRDIKEDYESFKEYISDSGLEEEIDLNTIPDEPEQNFELDYAAGFSANISVLVYVILAVIVLSFITLYLVIK
jgi:hypothetical protein